MLVPLIDKKAAVVVTAALDNQKENRQQGNRCRFVGGRGDTINSFATPLWQGDCIS